jgi:hypothetical protein
VSDDKVVYLETGLDALPERVLDSDEVRECDTVVVLGWRNDHLFFATSTGDIAEVNLMLDLAKRATLREL